MSSERLAAPDDGAFMRRALALAERGWGQTAPNPMVGAVVVRDGVVVGEGWHARVRRSARRGRGAARRGRAGARRDALRHARAVRSPRQDAAVHRRDDRRRHHVASSSRVRDPSPVARGGAERLRAAGVEVTIGVEERRGARAQRAVLPRARERSALRAAQARALARRRDRRSHASARLVDWRAGAARSTSPACRRGRDRRRHRHRRSPTIPSSRCGTRRRRVSRRARVVFDTSARLPRDSKPVRRRRATSRRS